TCPGRTRTDDAREGRPGTYTDGPPVSWLVSVVGVGDIALVGINASPFSVIEQELRAQSPLAKTMFISGANGSSKANYVPTDAAYASYSFEVLETTAKPGCAQVALEKAATGLVSKYVSQGSAGK